MIVGTGVHLTIQPGTVVKFAPGTRIIVEDGGIVDAPATEAKPIILTSITDDVSGDTNLDASQSLPRPGDWNGIVTRGTGEFNDNRFVDVRYTQTEHSGLLSGDERWRGSFVHHVTGDVTVPGGVTLTIEAGAVVKFDAYKGLVVQPGGHLIALGAVAEPIVFTSSRDDTAGGDTNGDGDSTAPQPGDWRWIYVDGADATFDHVEMRYGGGTSSGNWDHTGVIRTTPGATVTLSNSILRDGFYECILAWAGGTVDVTSSVIAGCRPWSELRRRRRRAHHQLHHRRQPHRPAGATAAGGGQQHHHQQQLRCRHRQCPRLAAHAALQRRLVARTASNYVRMTRSDRHQRQYLA